MRKTLLLLTAMLLFVITMNAQTLTSKKGIPILPQKGDFALGVNAMPMLDYLGNTFNGTTNNTTAFDFIDGNNYIFGKYFYEDLKAYRFGIRVGHTRATDGRYLWDDLDSTFTDQVIDKYTKAETNILLNIGMEKRKGVHRIQGYFGGELLLGLSSATDSYVYGNLIDEDNKNPTTTNFGSNIHMSGARTLTEKDGLEFGVGIRGFVGMEYFIFPKLSLGGEFGWGLMVGSRMASKVNVEYWDLVEDDLMEKEWKVDQESLFNLDTDNFGGMIRLLFHF